MPLRRVRASSLQLSVERLRIATWQPPRPPTPRRSTYPQPGTTSLHMAAVLDTDVPPVPPLSYWEPETPSPTSPYNPFLSPPAVSSSSLRAMVSPLLLGSPVSFLDSRSTPRSWSFASPQSSPYAGPDLSPRFLNPRTPPLPPTARSVTNSQRRHSTTCSVPVSEFEKMKQQSLRVLIITAREVLEDRKTKKEKITSGDKGFFHGYKTTKRRRERRSAVRMKSFQVLKQST